MARANEKKDETASSTDDLDAASGPRRKGPPSEAVQLLVAEFRRRSAGMSGSDLDAEVDRFIERMIERSARVAPETMAPHVREMLRSRMREDPTLLAMLGDLKAAARRG